MENSNTLLSTTASVNCRLRRFVSLSLLIASSMRFCSHATWRENNCFYVLSCVLNASLCGFAEERHMSKKVSGPGEKMAPSQEHDTHYWLDYNEEQGNSSQCQWCLCIDDLKTQNNMYLSHTDTESTNKQPPTSTFIQLN